MRGRSGGSLTAKPTYSGGRWVAQVQSPDWKLTLLLPSCPSRPCQQHQPFLIHAQVPWGGKELALGMVGWAVTFVAVGLAFIPVVRLLAGPEVRPQRLEWRRLQCAGLGCRCWGGVAGKQTVQAAAGIYSRSSSAPDSPCPACL